MERKNFPSSLVAARAKAKLTQDDLAAKLNLTRTAISQWECGSTAPSGPSRLLMSIALGLPLAVVDSWFEVELQAKAS